jgi:hypothetical protein
MDEKETLFGTGFYPAAYPKIIRNSTTTNKYKAMAGPSITNRSLSSITPSLRIRRSLMR